MAARGVMLFQQLLIRGTNCTSPVPPMHVSAGVSGNIPLPDPIPYALFLETINGLRYLYVPETQFGAPLTAKGGKAT